MFHFPMGLEIESSKYFCFLSVMIIIQFKIKVTKHNLMMYPYPKSFQWKKKRQNFEAYPWYPL